MIIDDMASRDDLWRLHCRREFKNVYKIAGNKAQPGFLWFHIYRSLSLWSQLSKAREQRDEYAAAADKDILNFKILRDGIIGVHRKGVIEYCDMDFSFEFKHLEISGEYSKYSENDYFILVHDGYENGLYIYRRGNKYWRPALGLAFIPNVKSFILVEREVYYVTLKNKIYVCPLENVALEATGCQYITYISDKVLCLGYTNMLHVLTSQRNIYTLGNDNELHFTYSIDSGSNLLHQLKEYNFLENMDWQVYIQWVTVLSHPIPASWLCDIVLVRVYGDVAFVGCNRGVLRIYYAPYNGDGQFDLFNSEPVKQYNFMERYHCPESPMCPIRQIDIMEEEAGHRVLVAMPRKIVVLKFTHSFNETASVVMQPYN